MQRPVVEPFWVWLDKRVADLGSLGVTGMEATKLKTPQGAAA